MEVLLGYSHVLGAVLVESIPVISLAVDLNRNAPIHDKIDPLGVAEPNLALDTVPGHPEPSARQALRKAFARWVDPIDDPSERGGEVRGDPREIDGVDQARMSGPIQSGNRILRAFVEHNPGERINQRNRGTGAPLAQFVALPVENDAAGVTHIESSVAVLLGTHSGGVTRHGDMQRMIVSDDPAPKKSN
jgi:hypothetical protein